MADTLISAFDRALRAVTASARPAANAIGRRDAQLPDGERAHAAALMRVNHVGEICAQGLYHGQAFTAGTPEVRAHMERAAVEEGEHLALCAVRIAELGGRTSLLNPLWYAGSFALGALAGRAGDAVSLGVVAETERQVEAHLESHLAHDAASYPDRRRRSLPAEDAGSRALVAKMRDDEARHRYQAQAAGGAALPLTVRLAMKAMAKMMTTVAYRI